MKEFYTRDRLSLIATAIAQLIKKRNPKVKIEALKDEATLYTLFIFSKALSLQPTQKKVGKEMSSYEELKAFNEHLKETSRLAYSLSEDAKLQIWLSYALKGNLLHSDANAWDRLCNIVNEGEEIIENALSGLSPRGKGRPKQSEKEDFIETSIQVFEKASGIKINTLNKWTIIERRKIKTNFYNFLEVSILNKSLFLSKEALRKFADRYIASGRPQQEFIQESFEDFLKTN